MYIQTVRFCSYLYRYATFQLAHLTLNYLNYYLSCFVMFYARQLTRARGLNGTWFIHSRNTLPLHRLDLLRYSVVTHARWQHLTVCVYCSMSYNEHYFPPQAGKTLFVEFKCSIIMWKHSTNSFLQNVNYSALNVSKLGIGVDCPVLGKYILGIVLSHNV